MCGWVLNTDAVPLSEGLAYHYSLHNDLIRPKGALSDPLCSRLWRTPRTLAAHRPVPNGHPLP
jgi:hypothetical protein